MGNIHEDILSYNPDLNIITRPKSGINKEEKKVSSYENNYEVGLSNTLLEFIHNSPAEQITYLNEVIQTAEKYGKEMLELDNKNSYVARWLSAKSEEEEYDILEENQNDLTNGSTFLESYDVIQEIIYEMKDILSLFTTCIFGSDIDTDNVKLIEQEHIDKIIQLEQSNNYKSINYFNLYYDAQLAYLLRRYCENILGVCIALRYMKEEKEKINISNSQQSLLKDTFDKLNKVLEQYKYNNDSCSINITTAINNIFLSKQKVNSYLDIFSSLYQFGERADVFEDLRIENVNELEQKLDNLIRTILNSYISKDDIVKNLEKKENLRSFFVA